MARILVTGASGFVGGHLVEALLARGAQVRCLLRPKLSPGSLPLDEIETHTGDLLDIEAVTRAVEGCETVYHVAGATGALRPEDFRKVNVDGTANVVQACLAQQRSPILLVVSSVSAVGPATRDRPHVETDPPCPMSLYGKSKRGGEEVAEAEAARLPLTIVRPGIVFGPRDRALLPAVRMIWRARCHVLPRLRTPPLSFIEVRDLAQILIAAAERGRRVAPPGTMPPGTGDGYYFATLEDFPTYSEFGQILARAMGRRGVLPVTPPRPIPWLVGLVNEGIAQVRQRPAVYSRDKFYEAVVESWACSNRATREQLGFTPSAPFDQQVRETIRWYVEHGWLKTYLMSREQRLSQL